MAKEFRFYTRLNLVEFTGRKARNIRELLECIKEVPGSVIYNHTHSFLKRQHYLTPEPPNDFAYWVGEVLQERTLGEQLASVDVREHPTIRSLREKIIETIENYLARTPAPREAPRGQEFYFIKAVTFVLPTAHVAHDLNGFLEILNKISANSIYYHLFEARLRLPNGKNDFSNWIEDSAGDKELAGQIGSLDPYTYTLGDLRKRIVELIENRIGMREYA